MTAGEADPGGTTGILEMDPTGHRLQYVGYLCEALGEGQALVLVPGSALDTEEFDTHLGGARAVSVPVSEHRRRALRQAVAHVTSTGRGHLVITEADGHLVALVLYLLTHLRQDVRLHLLLMRSSTIGGAGPATPALVMKPLLVALLRRSRRVDVHFLTDALGVVERRRGFPGVPPVRDPVQLSRAGSVPPIPDWWPAVGQEQVVVGVLGVISPRKNLPLLVDAAALAPQVVLVVGGRLTSPVADFVATDPAVDALRRQGRIVVVDRHLSTDELDGALGAADVVAVLHDNDAPSGILAEACLRETPVVAVRDTWLGRVVEATGIGRTTELTGPAVGRAAVRCAEERDHHRHAARRARARLGTEHFTRVLLPHTAGSTTPCHSGRTP